MKKFILLLLLIVSGYADAQLPKPDNIVIIMFQNKDYTQIVGSPNAPYINSLIADTNTALLTQSYALVHPSQPNYLMLYSGSNQGVTDDNVPAKTPFTTCNLGSSLLAATLTFTGYSESMPSAGYLGTATSLYARKHNPWSDWQGTQTNGVPAKVNQPFSSFPGDYNLLPTVSIIVPNIINCMHDGSILQGDTWFQNNLDGYVQWTKTHNSLLILTFDEDNSGNGNNRILTFFLGKMVKPGSYSNRVNHFNLLRTIEGMYGLPACGTSSISTAIDYIWKTETAGINKNSALLKNINISPVPSNDHVLINTNSEIAIKDVIVSVNDFSGRQVSSIKINIMPGENTFRVDINELDQGIYFVNIAGKEINFNRKILKE